MGLTSEERVLPYTLCAFTGAGIMFNTILLIWHCVKFKAGKETRYLKYAFGGLSISYIFIGLAVTLLILYSDVNSEDLCKIGGFLSLFASQESFWMLATSCLVYLLWIRTRMSSNQCSSSEYEITNKWSVPIFILILIVKCIVLAIVSFLPMTNIAYFNIDTQYYYLCIPIRIPKEQGWPYSTLILILDWVALLIAIGNFIAVNVMLRKNKKHFNVIHEDKVDKTYICEREIFKVEFTLNISFGFNNIFWALILMLLSINYFSGGLSISRDSIHWIIGFLVSLLIVFHPVIICALHFIVKTKWFNQRYFIQEECFNTECPKRLESVLKLPIPVQYKDISGYIVHWKDHEGHFLSGIMKAFHPSANQKWRNEIRAVSKITNNTSPEHPNIVKYYWQASKNKYATMIYGQTGDMLSLESSLICKSHYAHGSLQQFLKSRVHQLTEVGIHKVTLDVANGLDFIHEQGIVHNMLNTKCVYMASVSEKIGLRAVIGDFENSTEVATTLEQVRSREHLYAISYGKNIENSDNSCQFSPDIRAFGVLVLEILISLSEYNHLQSSKTNDKESPCHMDEFNSSAFQMMPNTPVVSYGQITASRQLQNTQKKHSQTNQTHSHHHNKKHSKACSCSSKVTEIRAHSKELQSESNLRFSCSSKSPSLSQNYPPEVNVECEPNVDASLDPIGKINDITNPGMYSNVQALHDQIKLQNIQQRELPPIPIHIEKVVAEVAMSTVKVKNENLSFSSSDNKRRQSSEDRKPKNIKPKVKPKPNLLKSIQRSMIVNESGESDVDSLYIRSPDSISGPSIDTPSTDSDNSGECAITASKTILLSSANKSNDVTNDDMYNASVNSCGSFETIYEDDESQDSMVHSLDSGLGKGQMNAEKYQSELRSLSHIKRKVNGNTKLDTETWKKKRLSGTSFNESVLSGDSGMGSSHYGASSDASHRIYAMPGCRGTIYELGTKELEEDSYSLLNSYLERNRQKINNTNIVDSLLDSKEDNSRSVTLPGYNPSNSLDIPSNPSLISPVEENFDELYEMLPDLMVRKKPCQGQHKQIPGVTCCSNVPSCSNVNTSNCLNSNITTETKCSEQSNKSFKSSGSSSKHLHENVSSLSSKQRTKHRHDNTHGSNISSDKSNIDSIDISKMLVDESTMTTDSLERQKPQLMCDLHSVVTDTESIITEISCTSGITTGSRNQDYNNHWIGNGTRLSDTDSQISGKPPSHNGAVQRSVGSRPHNVPKLGLTAVAFSRQMNTSAQSTPLSCTMSGPSGSMQSLVTGRSSVMSARSTGGQSARSFPGGTNSINSSVLSLLQDSNLLVANNNRPRHYRGHSRHSRSNKGAIHSPSQSSMTRSKLREYSPNVVTNHPVVKQIVDMPSENVATVLDTLKKKGYLGYTAAQLVPLLKDCWLHQDVPSTQDILLKLGQVLPTATV